MKAVIGFLCLFVGVLAQDTPCKTGSDCGDGECCLSTAQFLGKRQIAAYCRPRGDLGKSCYVNNDNFMGQEDSTMYYNGCPCLSGQECEGSGLFEVPQGEHGKCVAATKDKRQVTSCNSVADCASNECCIANNQPIGKKRQARAGGTCRALGGEGDSCLVAITSVGTMNYACPCEAGLTCEGMNLFEVPLGERGQCTKATKDSSCSSAADCAADECCVSLFRPEGKKRQTGRECRKRGVEGASCLMSSANSDQDVYYECPCVSGLKCVGTGQFDIPLGETGTCTA